MEALIRRILDKRRECGRKTMLVALDGPCASGKTTLARQLQSRLGCRVVSMDDFFLQPHQRTPARLNTPGENVDHERFLAEVLLPLSREEPCAYRPYDCHRQSFGPAVTLRPGTLVIVEGAYSCHSALWPYYALRIFLRVEPREQLRRIARRNGPEGLEVFRSRWIPMEQAYFQAFSIQQRCDIVL